MKNIKYPSKFLGPPKGKILLFLFFLFVALAGYIQVWAFAGKDMGLPKPLFYDLLNPFLFWSLWIMLFYLWLF